MTLPAVPDELRHVVARTSDGMLTDQTVDTLLRLLYLKHRYQLVYESLCREVSDSIGWRRFCRIGLDRPVPHPTTLVKLVRRAGPEVIDELNGRCCIRCNRVRAARLPA